MTKRSTKPKKPRPPKVSDADRLAAACPKCGAIAGHKCHDYRGTNKAFCVERGRPDITAKKLQKKADYFNAKVGPDAQFPGLLAFTRDAEEFKAEFKPVTAADVAAAKLRSLRMGVGESGGSGDTNIREGLSWITLRYLRRVAAELVGAEWEAKLWARAMEIYGEGKLEYIQGHYSRALCTTDQIDLGYVVHEEPCEKTQWNTRGVRMRLEVTAKWPFEGYTPVMTREEFRARFSLAGMFWKGLEGQEDDPTGLWEKTIGVLKAKGNTREG